jgi:hypothetical protein
LETRGRRITEVLHVTPSADYDFSLCSGTPMAATTVLTGMKSVPQKIERSHRRSQLLPAQDVLLLMKY